MITINSNGIRECLNRRPLTLWQIMRTTLKILAIAFAWPMACLAVWGIVVVLGYFGVNPR